LRRRLRSGSLLKSRDSEGQVTALLGPPTSNDNNNLLYPTSVGLRSGMTAGRVSGVLSFFKHQKTSKGITIGSSRARLKSAYPRDKCAEGPYGPRWLYCAGSGPAAWAPVIHQLPAGTATGCVEEIELGYGVGLAQKLKEQRKSE
jgi:hypothetical protein